MLLTNPNNREYIISVERISIGAKIILQMLILYGIFILEKWAKENNLDENILLAMSPIRYFNDEQAL